MKPKRQSVFTRMRDEDPEAFRAMSARGGLTRAALHGRDTNLAIARAAFKAKQLARVNPNGDLPPEEVAIRLRDLNRVRAMKMREGQRRKQLAKQNAAAAARLAELEATAENVDGAA